MQNEKIERGVSNVGEEPLMGEARFDPFGQAALDGVAFIGNTLAPFFLQDPQSGDADAMFTSFAALSVAEAAFEWPFVSAEEACGPLNLMVQGLASSVGENGRFVADEALTWEYRRLFVGPAALPVPPWGSVYTDRECVIFGKTNADLHEWMAKHGVQRSADESEPDDHIGLMLSLMAWLAQNQPENLEEYLADHLLTWSGHFLEELADAAEHPFYEGLAKLTAVSLQGMQHAFGLSVKTPHFYR